MSGVVQVTLTPCGATMRMPPCWPEDWADATQRALQDLYPMWLQPHEADRCLGTFQAGVATFWDHYYQDTEERQAHGALPMERINVAEN